MFVTKESHKGSGGIEVFDINRTRTENLIYPLVETGSVKNVFKKYVYQPNVKSYFSDHFNIYRNWQIVSGSLFENANAIAVNGEVTSSYGYESPIKRNLTSRQSTISANYWNYNTGRFYTGQSRPIVGSERLPISLNLSASALQNVARNTQFCQTTLFLLVRPLDLEILFMITMTLIL